MCWISSYSTKIRVPIVEPVNWAHPVQTANPKLMMSQVNMAKTTTRPIALSPLPPSPEKKKPVVKKSKHRDSSSSTTSYETQAAALIKKLEEQQVPIPQEIRMVQELLESGQQIQLKNGPLSRDDIEQHNIIFSQITDLYSSLQSQQ